MTFPSTKTTHMRTSRYLRSVISICTGCLLICSLAGAQARVDLSHFNSSGTASVAVSGEHLTIAWDAGKGAQGQADLDLRDSEPLFSRIAIGEGKGDSAVIARHLDPVFILTVGKRKLTPEKGWLIFFDNPYRRPYDAYRLELDKRQARVVSEGSRTRVVLSGAKAGPFTGDLEITFFGGSPLFKIDAVMSTNRDSVAVVYDAGLIARTPWDKDRWNNVNPFGSLHWEDVQGTARELTRAANPMQSVNLAVRYRTMVASSGRGSLAVFPPPHQYFFPEDNCYNMAFVWYGRNYRDMIPQFGIGIRQELEGDKRFVPWFNAPPGSRQHMSFFCLVGSRGGRATLEAVKAYTHQDKYVPLPGYYTMTSHYHTEPEMDALKGKPLSEIGQFVTAFKDVGVDIVHLASFHGVGHPEGPDSLRLRELETSFQLARRWSGHGFLLLPGEEPDHFFGGHWISLFPRPVYWVMSRKTGQPFVEQNARYGKVYHVGDVADMTRLLDAENGLVWTSHPRIKGSVGYPDGYKNEDFYKSDRFLGAAWKALPADLSHSVLGKRALDVLNDMENWGQKKYMLGEGDMFKMLPQYELYGNMNINYLQMDSLPSFDEGWQSVLNTLRAGRFFVTTGEVLITRFSAGGKTSGETLTLDKSGKANLIVDLSWTFPMNYLKITSGDGNKVYEKVIPMSDSRSFGHQVFNISLDLKNRKWVRVAAWDVAADGAFTQCVWIR